MFLLSTQPLSLVGSPFSIAKNDFRKLSHNYILSGKKVFAVFLTGFRISLCYAVVSELIVAGQSPL